MNHITQSHDADHATTDYRSLMQHRIRKILLISSSYDAYILEEDGRLEAQIIEEYTELNLSNPPSFTRVTTASEALGVLARDAEFDLVITMYNVGEPDAFEFARMVKAAHPGLPIVLLTSFSKEIYARVDSGDRSAMDYIFFWYGNADLIMAIIKLIEDRMNADADILGSGVQAILLVEDSIKYYSTYLPAIYKLVLTQSGEFLKEALNEQQQMLRKRARPKILLATNYDDAVGDYEKYKENLLGVISDVGFVVHKNDPAETEKQDAGIDLCRLIKADNPLMPFLMQSSQESMRAKAEELGVGFVQKYSKTLLMELADYISKEFAFGDFVFRDPDTGEVVGQAKDLREMQRLVKEVPADVLRYHAGQNHLSKWLYARGLFRLGSELRIMKSSNFPDTDELREVIRNAIKDYRILLGQGVVARFDAATYNDSIGFVRIGEGSLGGKARGLAFFNTMLQKYNFYDKYPGARVMLPRTAAVTTEFFDRFIVENGLQYVVNSDADDEEILSEFVSSRLPEELVSKLRLVIRYSKGPLAIRSSSKLEDSIYQPFAGIYSTYMIPRTKDRDQMLRLLGKAIKSVYASVFFRASRAYITATSNVLSDEKMAVVIQEVCGTEDNGWFFPTISGIARSINFYPIGDEKPGDGIATIALGLGKLVVEGGKALRFSPRHPEKALQLSTPQLALRDTQREMYALNLEPEAFKTSIDDGVNLGRFGINSPEVRTFRNMDYAASTWDEYDECLRDGNHGRGGKVVTFANILKYNTFPLAQILSDMLAMGEEEMRGPVEIEFAVNMDVPRGKQAYFNFLQIRPIVDGYGKEAVDWSETDTSGALIYAEKALGVGAISGVHDIVYVRSEAFDNTRTEEIAEEVRRLNAEMVGSGSGYVLVGPGRWGTSDRFLGIPIKWADISQAKVIVECGLENFRVEPSQGTHFFQNLTSFGVGYLTVNPFMGDGRFNIDALDRMPADYEGRFIRRIHFNEPLHIFIDGRSNKGIVK